MRKQVKPWSTANSNIRMGLRRAHEAQLNAITALCDACQSWAGHSKPNPQPNVRPTPPKHTPQPMPHKPMTLPLRQSPRVHTTPSPPIPPQPAPRVEPTVAPDMPPPRVPNIPPHNYCQCQYVDAMEDPIGRRHCWTGDRLVAILHRIGDALCFGVFRDDSIAPVVFEGDAHAPSFFSPKVSRVSCRSFLVDHDGAPKWAQRCGVILERGSLEVFPSRYFWVDVRLAQQVECQLGLRQE